MKLYLIIIDEGKVFGWGNSEYGQFDMVTSEPQINQPTLLPLSSTCGKVNAVAAAGTSCALLNGTFCCDSSVRVGNDCVVFSFLQCC